MFTGFLLRDRRSIPLYSFAENGCIYLRVYGKRYCTYLRRMLWHWRSVFGSADRRTAYFTVWRLRHYRQQAGKRGPRLGRSPRLNRLKQSHVVIYHTVLQRCEKINFEEQLMEKLSKKYVSNQRKKFHVKLEIEFFQHNVAETYRCQNTFSCHTMYIHAYMRNLNIRMYV